MLYFESTKKPQLFGKTGPVNNEPDRWVRSREFQLDRKTSAFLNSGRAVPACSGSDRPHQFRTRNELIKRQRTRTKSTKTAGKSTKLIAILPLITVCAQLQVMSDDNEINGERGTRFGCWTFAPNTRVEDSSGNLLSFFFAVASNPTTSS